ncbi:MAG: B12-binding domain-containing radical SAM protein [candidate division KSB1 bacterium]|nr:B12-binding domain-containing radical SAM protein [candidate division KSB1 bacterium]
MSCLVLVNQWVEGISNNKPPLGLGYLVAYLKRYLDFDDVEVVNTGKGVFERICDANPRIVGFTAYSANYAAVLGLARQVKKELGVITLLGGPHITALPQSLDTCVDVGVLGEGEETLVDLMRLFLEHGRLEPTRLAEVPGIVFHRDGGVCITAPRRPIFPLDAIPLPDRDALDIERFLRPSPILMNNQYLRGTTMLTSRGCPFKCIYCHVSAKWGRPRFHSPERVAEEVEVLVKRYGVEGIYIADDLFTANATRIKKIISGLDARGVLGRVRFFVDLRANLVTDHVMGLLRDMGVVKVSLGLESGSDRVLSYLKGGDVTVAQNRQAVAIANRHGIGCYCCFMLGAPHETRADIRLTQGLIKEILDAHPQNFCQVSVTTPLPGTALWEYAVERGIIGQEVDWSQFSLNPELSLQPDFYVNEEIPFAEFQRLVRETMEIAGSRRLPAILRHLSRHYVVQALRRPDLALRIARDYLKHRK